MSWAQGVLISEFQAINDSTLMDEDGDFPDWIELMNLNIITNHLEDYFLTDSPDDLTKWQLPVAALLPFESVVIFASGKNRPHTPTLPTSLVVTGSVWAYFSNGTDPGASWNQSGFDDSAWSTGPATLGYGDGDESTTLGFGGDPGNKYAAAYFRHHFVVTNPASLGAMKLHIDRDDGAIVYLNGVEVFRENMPTGSVDHLTFADKCVGGFAASGGEEGVFSETWISPTLLTAGTNVLAVEVHQCSGTSSDLQFDLSLEANGLIPHANFKLSGDGGYLALVDAATNVVTFLSNPEYPKQYPDVSYGSEFYGFSDILRTGPGYILPPTPGVYDFFETPAPHPLFSEKSVGRIDLYISESGWNSIQSGSPSQARTEQTATLRFRQENIDVTLDNVGVRARGNTSLLNKPRSLRISFDSYVPGQRLFGQEKLNLNAQVNDPATARSKLVTDLHAAAGLEASYANHIALVVHLTNGTQNVFFEAVLNNTQPIDDVFIEQRYGASDVNLYKCIYQGAPAGLTFLGTNGSAYMSSTYELKYQGGLDGSYNDLAGFVDLINNTPSNDFPLVMTEQFEAHDFLKRMALDVLTGNWDSYWGNANNFYLFQHPHTRKWTYVPFDMDNTFGIRWIGTDWAAQNIYTFDDQNGLSRPLTERLLDVPEFSNRYSYYMNEMLNAFYTTNDLFPLLTENRFNLVSPLPFDEVSVANMKFEERAVHQFNSPYWDYFEFFSSYDTAQFTIYVPNHYGLREFIISRRTNALNQLALTNISPILENRTYIPAQPSPSNDIVFSVDVEDDSAGSPVVELVTRFEGGAWTTGSMTSADGQLFSATLPALGSSGTLEFYFQARDVENKVSFNPWNGEASPVGITIGAPEQNLVITELQYHPPVLTPTESLVSTNLEDFEFIELYNAGDQVVNLENLSFVDGVNFVFPTIALGPTQYVVVVAHQSAFESRYGTNRPVAGEFSGKLSNGGEIIRLIGTNGISLIEFAYDDDGSWPGRADGDGSSLELIAMTNTLNEGKSWRSSSEYAGTPGEAGAGPDNRVVVNEVLAHTDLPQVDSIELMNTTDSAIDISHWMLSDASSNYRKYQIPSNTILAAESYLVLDETNAFNQSMGVDTNDFSLSAAHGDDVYLLQADGLQALQGFVDRVSFGATANGESMGRWPNGLGGLYPMSALTLGGSNSGPRVGPVVISEIMYHPVSGDSNLEYVEILNPGPGSEDLTDWEITGGIDFAFPSNVMISAEQKILVLPFDPTNPVNAALLQSFQLTYGVASNVMLLGEYSGSLGNGGDTVRLRRADDPPAEEPTFIPLLLEDEVDYNDDLPWPTAADGTGPALTRLAPGLWGNDPMSWDATAVPSPGSGPLLLDADTDDLPDVWEIEQFGAINHPDASGGLDPDMDGVNNTGEYTAGTVATNGASLPEINIVMGPDQLPQIQFETLPATGVSYFGVDRYYTLEVAPSLTSLWSAVPGVSNVMAVSQTMIETSAPPTGSGYYRLDIHLE